MTKKKAPFFVNEKVEICGIGINNVNMKEATKMVRSFLDEDCLHLVFTPNSEIIMAAQREEELKKILNSSDLLVADGAGVVIASKILGTPLKERVAGFDLINSIFNSQDFKDRNFFFFGTKPEIIEKASSNISKKFNINISGYIDGYFKPEDEEEIINRINSSKADILMVALGAPRQEKWLYQKRNLLTPRVCIGVGGSFDVFAGVAKRAPLFFQKCNIEWLYRLVKEPWRYKRMLDLPRFMLFVITTRLKKIC